MLTQKTKYALKALGLLAFNYGRGPILMSKIAQQKNIPLGFLENIFHELKKEGLLVSHRGRFGGYTLADYPENINLAKIIRIVNGPIAMLPCVSLNFYASCEHCKEETCGLQKTFIAARDAMIQILENQNLRDIIDQDEILI